MMEGFIPVLDLSEDSPDRQAEIVKSALGSIGFLEVRGSKISHTEVSQIFDYVSMHRRATDLSFSCFYLLIDMSL